MSGPTRELEKKGVRRTSMLATLRRACGWALLGFLLGAACARVRPLEGGPPDLSPPQVVEAFPADSSVLVPRFGKFEIIWNEKLSSTEARRGVRIEPPVRIANVQMHGSRMVVTLAESLPPDTTVVVVLTKRIRDQSGRDNPLIAEIPLVYSTGPRLRGASVFGKVLVKGRGEPNATVRWEPVPPDSGRSPPRRRGPAAVVDAEGLFRLFAVPPDRPFRLRAFVDRDGDLVPDDEELASFYPETLRLGPGEVRRGIDWNLIDPDEKGQLSGVATNSTGLRGPIAIAVRRVAPSPGAKRDSVEAAAAGVVDSAASGSPDRDDTSESSGRATARADTVRPMDRFPVPPRDSIPWATAYALLEPRGFVRREWTVVYASPRGDYSVRVAPGTQAVLAFIDVRRDSVPGMYVLADTSGLAWEPLGVGERPFVGPGAKTRAKTIDIRGP
jgi:hypothetical protein